jgi:hypothetical protein
MTSDTHGVGRDRHPLEKGDPDVQATVLDSRLRGNDGVFGVAVNARLHWIPAFAGMTPLASRTHGGDCHSPGKGSPDASLLVAAGTAICLAPPFMLPPQLDEVVPGVGGVDRRCACGIMKAH